MRLDDILSNLPNVYYVVKTPRGPVNDMLYFLDTIDLSRNNVTTFSIFFPIGLVQNGVNFS